MLTAAWRGVDEGDVVAEADRDDIVFDSEDDGCAVGYWVIGRYWEGVHVEGQFLDPDAVDDVIEIRWKWQHVIANWIAVSWWTEGGAACGHSLDTTFARFDGDFFRVYEDRLEIEQVIAGNAGTDPAVVLVDTSRSAQDFPDDVCEIEIGGATILKTKIDFHIFKAMRRVDDCWIAVNQASHR